ncbi:MAG: patatin-like phospholipase family protein [Syntrophaceae bacterium]
MPVGLALGGGGARGLASIGVIDVLEHHGIRVDMVAGTSMGAIVATLYASGLNAAEIERVAKGRHFLKCICVNWSRSLVHGLLTMDKLKKYLSSFVPATFDKLYIPLTIMTTDMDSGCPVLLDKGDILEAVVASCSIPVLFRPVTIDGRWLFDGGIVEQIPTRPLIESGCQPVYAVSCGYVAKTAPQYRGMINIASRSLDMLGKANMRVSLNMSQCLAICPEVEKFGIFAFSRMDDIIQEGRLAAGRLLGSP